MRWNNGREDYEAVKNVQIHDVGQFQGPLYVTVRFSLYSGLLLLCSLTYQNSSKKWVWSHDVKDTESLSYKIYHNSAGSVADAEINLGLGGLEHGYVTYIRLIIRFSSIIGAGFNVGHIRRPCLRIFVRKSICKMYTGTQIILLMYLYQQGIPIKTCLSVALYLTSPILLNTYIKSVLEVKKFPSTVCKDLVKSENKVQ